MKLIILEGPDGVGKSTQAQRLVKALGAKLVVQPSAENALGFLRPIVKTQKDIEPFARQLLHTCSHIVDAYEDFGPHNPTLVMDRCYASALVYGKMTGLPQQQLDILRQIHQNVYSPLVQKYGYDVYYIQFSAKKPLRTPENTDVYEQTTKFSGVNNTYTELFTRLTHNKLFTKNEAHLLIQIDGHTPDHISHEILDFIKTPLSH